MAPKCEAASLLVKAGASSMLADGWALAAWSASQAELLTQQKKFSRCACKPNVPAVFARASRLICIITATHQALQTLKNFISCADEITSRQLGPVTRTPRRMRLRIAPRFSFSGRISARLPLPPGLNVQQD